MGSCLLPSSLSKVRSHMQTREFCNSFIVIHSKFTRFMDPVNDPTWQRLSSEWKRAFSIEKIQWVNIFFSGLLDRLD